MADKEKTIESLRNLAKENGMIPLWQACKQLVLQGHTSLQELMSLNDE